MWAETLCQLAQLVFQSVACSNSRSAGRLVRQCTRERLPGTLDVTRRSSAWTQAARCKLQRLHSLGFKARISLSIMECGDCLVRTERSIHCHISLSIM
mmetsp:Transcript_51023/g.136081  ORF Transcript_51023/g.136081 Transcript_51023/m.136081 type:complete len:98 (+) Transcript_51023:307-600(+)